MRRGNSNKSPCTTKTAHAKSPSTPRELSNANRNKEFIPQPQGHQKDPTQAILAALRVFPSGRRPHELYVPPHNSCVPPIFVDHDNTLGFGRAPRIISDVSVFCDFQDLNSARTFSPDQEWLQMADSACDGRWIYLVSVLFLMFGFPVELFQNFRNTFAFVFMSKSGKIGPQKSVEGHLNLLAVGG